MKQIPVQCSRVTSRGVSTYTGIMHFRGSLSRLCPPPSRIIGSLCKSWLPVQTIIHEIIERSVLFFKVYRMKIEACLSNSISPLIVLSRGARNGHFRAPTFRVRKYFASRNPLQRVPTEGTFFLPRWLTNFAPLRNEKNEPPPYIIHCPALQHLRRTHKQTGERKSSISSNKWTPSTANNSINPAHQEGNSKFFFLSAVEVS